MFFQSVVDGSMGRRKTEGLQHPNTNPKYRGEDRQDHRLTMQGNRT
jgi:hypothetical protein